MVRPLALRSHRNNPSIQHTALPKASCWNKWKNVYHLCGNSFNHTPWLTHAWVARRYADLWRWALSTRHTWRRSVANGAHHLHLRQKWMTRSFTCLTLFFITCATLYFWLVSCSVNLSFLVAVEAFCHSTSVCLYTVCGVTQTHSAHFGNWKHKYWQHMEPVRECCRDCMSKKTCI